jgi:lipopolysaccharide transport system ATP-binding protein
MTPAVRVENLGKQYRIGAVDLKLRPRETLAGSLATSLASPIANVRRLRGLTQFESEEADNTIWAIRDVSFELAEGEVLGIVGRNGAGKSTLLKILSRTVEPTQGRAMLWGRTASLLEVGTGFHGDLTGRENVYLNGAILGMRRREIDNRFDEIVEFANLEKFIETPVKRYSSGMYLRLAFAVAAHLDSDILIADEVLAVGDAEFQRKCLGKMKEVSTSGRTVVFVSHNKAAVANLCTRAIWLELGRVRGDGRVEEVLASYISSIQTGAETSVRERVDRGGDGRVRITNVEFLDGNGAPTTNLISGEDAKIVITYEGDGSEPVRHAHAAVSIETTLGEKVGAVSSLFTGDEFDKLPRNGRITCDLPGLPLNTGEYVCNVWIASADRFADDLHDAAVFAVEALDFYGSGRHPEPSFGPVLLTNNWTIESA